MFGFFVPTLIYNSFYFFSGVIDFDLETLGDPAQHAEYAFETFQYYKVCTALSLAVLRSRPLQRARKNLAQFIGTYCITT